MPFENAARLRAPLYHIIERQTGVRLTEEVMPDHIYIDRRRSTIQLTWSGRTGEPSAAFVLTHGCRSSLPTRLPGSPDINDSMRRRWEDLLTDVARRVMAEAATIRAHHAQHGYPPNRPVWDSAATATPNRPSVTSLPRPMMPPATPNFADAVTAMSRTLRFEPPPLPRPNERPAGERTRRMFQLEWCMRHLLYHDAPWEHPRTLALQVLRNLSRRMGFEMAHHLMPTDIRITLDNASSYSTVTLCWRWGARGSSGERTLEQGVRLEDSAMRAARDQHEFVANAVALSLMQRARDVLEHPNAGPMNERVEFLDTVLASLSASERERLLAATSTWERGGLARHASAPHFPALDSYINDEAAMPRRPVRDTAQLPLLPDERPEPRLLRPRIANIRDRDASMASDGLTRSVEAFGVLQPVILRSLPPTQRGEHPEHQFVVVAGQRRVNAARAAGHEFIPALVFDGLSNVITAGMAVAENHVRAENLTSDLEAMQQLVMNGSSTDEIAAALSVPRAVVHRRVSLLGLTHALRLLVLRGVLSVGAGTLVGTWPQRRQTMFLHFLQQRYPTLERGRISRATAEQFMASLNSEASAAQVSALPAEPTPPTRQQLREESRRLAAQAGDDDHQPSAPRRPALSSDAAGIMALVQETIVPQVRNALSDVPGSALALALAAIMVAEHEMPVSPSAFSDDVHMRLQELQEIVAAEIARTGAEMPVPATA